MSLNDSNPVTVLAKKHEDAAFERNTLQSQLRNTTHELEKKTTEVVRLQQRCTSIQADAAHIRLQLATTQDKLDKVGC